MSVRTLALALPLAVLGCSSASMKNQAVTVRPEQVAALPAVLDEFRLGPSNEEVRNPEVERPLQDNVDTSINFRVSAAGGRFFPASALQSVAEYPNLRWWAKTTLRELLDERAGLRHADHEDVSDWRYSPRLTAVRQSLHADFALISMFIDGHEAVGLRVSNVLSPTKMVARRAAVACVLDLRDGRLARCSEYVPGPWNLADREGAQQIVDSLFQRLF
jgi:hypothetical protein